MFTALLAAALWKFDVVIDVLKTIWGSYSPLRWRRNCFCHQRADELSGKADLWEEQSRKKKAKSLPDR